MDSFSPCENSARIPLASYEIPEGADDSFLIGELYLNHMNEKR